MYLREYETIYILRPDLEEAEGAALSEKLGGILDKEGAKVLKQRFWGKKKLAYEIKKQPKGVYVSCKYLSGPTAVKEFERNLKIMDDVLKYQTIRVAENVDVEARLAQQEAEDKAQAVIDAQKKAEAAARAEAEAAMRQRMEEEEAKAQKEAEAKASSAPADEPEATEPEATEPETKETVEE